MTPLDPQDIIAAARRWVGTPYHHGAAVRGVGTDCLGLIRGVYADLFQRETAVPEPYSRHWAEVSGRETLLDAADQHLIRRTSLTPEPGVILAFRWRRHLPAKHLGIVSLPTTMIHAVEGSAVAEIPLSPWWLRHVAAAYDFPPRSL
jgi:NlpC/P60 family putative phage cell wall peptidase